MYDKDGGIPALSEVRFSLTSNRGCFGGCSFCALTFHEGRIVQTRSHESILSEARRMIQDPDFKGYIHDVGGPTADFRSPSCQKQLKKGVCPDRQCLFPKPCPNLKVDHSDYLSLLRKIRSLPGVKKVFIRSGIRFDYLMADKDRTFLKELCRYHVSGQLRVAPEHVSADVLRLMGKPEHKVYEAFLKEYQKTNRELGLKQYAVPYFISSHPGCTLRDAIRLAEYIRDLHFTPEQVQDFYPTRDPHEKEIQRALMQYTAPKNRKLVLEGLTKAGRTDLIGYGRECLIRPDKSGKRNDKTKKSAKMDRKR